ncbi:hypothetical protein NFI96_001848 [Prochilodus magdalenae]|nr:hypothetical protein NFI96_001848 [Prochilodus magdalenae]
MGSVVCQELKCGTVLTVSQGTFGQNGLLSKVDCSDWRRLLLTDPDHACSGKVYAWDQNRLIAISNEGWDAKKGAELCKYLNCGNFSAYSTESYKQHNRSYKCTGTPKTILDCEVKEASQLQHLSIKCNGNPEVKLLGNCTGEVMIKQNNRMCGNSNNTERVLGELCHHLHCRKFITSWTTNIKRKALYFSCSDHENRLWQCNSRNSSCDSIISVACAGGVEFNFTEECGGELQARYGGKWEPVCIKSIDDAHVICRYKNCGNATVFQHSKEHSGAQISIQCKNHQVSDPVDCIKYEYCRQRSTIICEKHVRVVGILPSLMVGLLFLLVVVVIVIWQRKHFLALLRLKCSPRDQDVELSRMEVQDLNSKNRDLPERKSSVFENDDYQDIDPTTNPMEEKPQSPDDARYEVGLDMLDDYDDAVPSQAVVSDTGESSFSEAHMSVEPAQNRMALRGSDTPCKGRLEVFSTGRWGLVCYHGWETDQSHKNGEVVCKSLGCGEHVKSGHNKDTYREPAPPTTFFMDEVKCNGTESSLWDCKTSRDARCPADNYVVVECTGSIELQLNKNGKTDECAGVVQFERKNDIVGVCSTRWNEARADMVCKELNCGTHYKIPKSGTFNKGKDGSSYNVPLSCTGNEEFSRQCVDWIKAKSNTCQEEANVICSKYKSFRLKSDPGNVCSGQLEEKDSTWKASWVPVLYENGLNETADDICSKLNCGKFSNMTRCEESNNTCLTCADKVKVELENKCYGNVYVNLNETRQTVCYDGLREWELSAMGRVVCQELKCGTLLTVSHGAKGQNGLLSKVDCSGEEESLWHCLAKYERSQSCSSTRVACTGRKRLLLTDPDSACSGKVYAWDQKGLTAVSSDGWEAKKGEELCTHLKCGNFRNYSTENNKPRDKSYNCSGTPKTILDCEVKETSSHFQHLNIICDGNPEVKLLGNCTGEVMINQSLRMCGNSHNTKRVLDELCHHLQCGKFVSSWTTKVKGEAQYFSCSGHENRLWQCNSWKDSCDTVISVSCVVRLKCSPRDQDVELSRMEVQDLNTKNRDLPDRNSSVFENEDYEDIDFTVNPMEEKPQSPGEDQKGSTSGDSSRTEYDDVEETSDRPQKSGTSSPSEPLFPLRPADGASYENVLDDYDEAVPSQAVVSDTGESSFSKAHVAADMSVEPVTVKFRPSVAGLYTGVGLVSQVGTQTSQHQEFVSSKAQQYHSQGPR